MESDPSPHQKDKALEAFWRLLAEANTNSQARVDALIALSQRTVYVCSFGTEEQGFRTLLNNEGLEALPIFTDIQALERAAWLYRWHTPDGQAPRQEVGARHALHRALADGIRYVVIDVGSDHALEIERTEFEPLLSPQARRQTSEGPFAASGKLSSTLTQAVKPPPSSPAKRVTQRVFTDNVASSTRKSLIPPPAAVPQDLIPVAPASPPPPRLRSPTPAGTWAGPALSRGRARTASTRPPPPAMAASLATTTENSGLLNVLKPLSEVPAEEVLDQLSEKLRNYPEVEWACLAQQEDVENGVKYIVGLRVDPRFRTRTHEIIGMLRLYARMFFAHVDILILDQPDHIQKARNEALMFYPWRR